MYWDLTQYILVVTDVSGQLIRQASNNNGCLTLAEGTHDEWEEFVSYGAKNYAQSVSTPICGLRSIKSKENL